MLPALLKMQGYPSSSTTDIEYSSSRITQGSSFGRRPIPTGCQIELATCPWNHQSVGTLDVFGFGATTSPIQQCPAKQVRISPHPDDSYPRWDSASSECPHRRAHRPVLLTAPPRGVLG